MKLKASAWNINTPETKNGSIPAMERVTGYGVAVNDCNTEERKGVSGLAQEGKKDPPAPGPRPLLLIFYFKKKKRVVPRPIPAPECKRLASPFLSRRKTILSISFLPFLF